MLRVESEGPVLHVTMDRPEVRNAFDEELIRRLYEVFTGLSPTTRAVVLTGAGETFCSGGDLNWMKRAASYTEHQNYLDSLGLANLFQSIVDCPAVVITRVNGPAFGGGCGLVAASDISLAHETARFAFSEVKLGLIPATISPFVLRKIGPGHARALFVTGEVFDARHALQIGLVHFVGTTDDVESELDRKLKSILSSGPSAVARAKRLALEPPLGSEESARLLAEVRTGGEAVEGVTAFLEKRPAAFVEKRG